MSHFIGSAATERRGFIGVQTPASSWATTRPPAPPMAGKNGSRAGGHFRQARHPIQPSGVNRWLS
jgi:hypothetical protein